MLGHLDIEAIRSAAKDRGRPIKSTTVIEDEKHIYYDVDKKGKVTIKEESKG